MSIQTRDLVDIAQDGLPMTSEHIMHTNKGHQVKCTTLFLVQESTHHLKPCPIRTLNKILPQNLLTPVYCFCRVGGKNLPLLAFWFSFSFRLSSTLYSLCHSPPCLCAFDVLYFVFVTGMFLFICYVRCRAVPAQRLLAAPCSCSGCH